jgi:hypothetical protein
MTIEFSPTLKQSLLFDYFEDDITTEILYGGSAGCGKSFGVCSLMIIKCLEHPNIRIGLARNELTTLKKTTMVSLFEVLNNWGLKVEEHYRYNSTTGEITFTNGSKIVLLELRYLPSDPDYTRLGGQLLTFAVIDEAGEVDEKGKQILQSRLGRWLNNDIGVKPILLMTCNPSKNFLYRDYYIPYTDNTLPTYKKFIPALITDNEYINQSYIDNLHKILTPIDKQRLIYGNWDYSSDPNSLIEYNQILSIFVNEKPYIESPINYISADIAFTSDNAVIIIWEGLTAIEIIVNPTDKIEDVIKDKAIEHNVKQTNISYDSDGVGKYLMNYLKQAKPIVNNARALENENYENLKTQLYFKLAEAINGGKLKVLSNLKYNDKISEELGMIKHKPTDNVGKVAMISKADVKRQLGRSPDFSDAMAYRMIFEIKRKIVKTFRM